MQSRKQADWEEQQRIKNLVLNYEASNETEATECKPPPLPLSDIVILYSWIQLADFEKRIPANQRLDKSGGRSAFRSRKLQLSDVNW